VVHSCLSPDSNQAGLLRVERRGEFRVRSLIAHARKGVLLDSPADAESGRDLFHSHHAHVAIQGNRRRPGTKSTGINKDIAANSLSRRARCLRDPVDPVAAKIHGNGIVGGAARRRHNPHRTPQCQSLSLPPLGIHRRHPNAPGFQTELPAIPAWMLVRRRRCENYSISSTSRQAVLNNRPALSQKTTKRT
jgi:hypothetical protein